MILTFDLGTSYFKFALVDRRGQLVEMCRIRPPLHDERPNIMELDARAFADILVDGVAQLEQRAPGSLASVKAVTFATQTNSFVLLDAGCRPLTPIILWPDERAAELEEEYRNLSLAGIRCDHRNARSGPARHVGQTPLDAAGGRAGLETGCEGMSDQRLLDVLVDRPTHNRGGRRWVDWVAEHTSLPLAPGDPETARDSARMAADAGSRGI